MKRTSIIYVTQVYSAGGVPEFSRVGEQGEFGALLAKKVKAEPKTFRETKKTYTVLHFRQPFLINGASRSHLTDIVRTSSPGREVAPWRPLAPEPDSYPGSSEGTLDGSLRTAQLGPPPPPPPPAAQAAQDTAGHLTEAHVKNELSDHATSRGEGNQNK